jgi:uncharacterized membrane protein
MRYVISMVFALIGFGLAVVYFSTPFADWVVANQTFDSPDAADSMHMLAFIGANVIGLIVGWIIGWAITGGDQAKQ